MKKTIIALAAVMFLISCGGSSETLDPVDSTTTNPVEVPDTSAVADSVSVADSSVGAIQGGGSSEDDVNPIEDKDNEVVAPARRVRGEVIK